MNVMTNNSNQNSNNNSNLNVARPNATIKSSGLEFKAPSKLLPRIENETLGVAGTFLCFVLFCLI
jgi:hypothetical protein